MLARWQMNQGHSYARVAPPPLSPPSTVTLKASLDDLLSALQRTLLATKEEPTDPAMQALVQPHQLTIGKQMQAIRQGVRARRTLRFSELLADTTSRLEIIVTFLAMLELLKRREVEVYQEGLFTEILIRAAPTPADSEATTPPLHPSHQ